MSIRFKGILSVLALLMGFSVAAQAEEASEPTEENSSFEPTVVLIGCHYGDGDFDVSSVTPALFQPVSVGDDCALALSDLVDDYDYEIEFVENNNTRYQVYTLMKDCD